MKIVYQAFYIIKALEIYYNISSFTFIMNMGIIIRNTLHSCTTGWQYSFPSVSMKSNHTSIF